MSRALNEQVVVITGASSGIGRETALQFGRAGASVVLAARNREALETAGQEIERLGGRAHVVPTDVAEWEQVRALAEAAIQQFGRIDTWVNDAAVSTYSTVEQTAVEEFDRLIQVNLLGQIYGVKAALPHMQRQGHGTFINVASALAERGVPLQAAYCASKHGVKGFTESLRLELERDHPDIRVTLIEPSSMNTPLFQHARSKLGVMPQPIPPVYEPGVVAEAILEAARHPRRTVVVGGSGKLFTLVQQLSPTLLDRYMLQGERMFKQQQSSEPDDGKDNLFEPMREPGSTTGRWGAKSKATSLYTRLLELHPGRKRMLNLATTGAGALLLRRVGR